MSSNNIYPIADLNRIWSKEDTDLLIKSWKSYGNFDELQKLFPQFTIEQIKGKRHALKLPYDKTRPASPKWSKEEEDLLREVWPSNHNISDIVHLFPLRHAKSIIHRANDLKIAKTPEVKEKIIDAKRKMLVERNQNVLGEKQSYERSKHLASKCNSYQEFKKLYESAYVYARINGFLHEICTHMIVGDSFSYPQAFMYGCLKQIFPENKILYNDRKTIYPKEIDVYLPELKIGFEYDGFLYHQNDDDTKDILCKEKGITLYKIKEKSKTKPESVILDSLNEFGFDISRIDVMETTRIAFTKKISEKEIIERISKFSSMKEFRNSDKNLYIWLKNRKLLGVYCSHLKQDQKAATKEEILEFIKSKTHKKDVCSSEEGRRYYLRFRRDYPNDVELNSAYHSLIGRGMNRKR